MDSFRQILRKLRGLGERVRPARAVQEEITHGSSQASRKSKFMVAVQSC